MFDLMKEYHEKFNSLNNLKPQTKDNKKLKQEVLTDVGDIYNELYDIYKSKYNKKIDRLSAKNKKNLDYKKLRLSDDYQYSSEEKQDEEQEKQKTNKMKKQLIHFMFQSPSSMAKELYKTIDKEN